MSKTKTSTPRISKPLYAGDPAIEGGFYVLLSGFINWLRAMHYSEHTIKTRRIELNYFIVWCEERSIKMPAEINRAILERYRQYTFHYHRQVDGLALSLNCQSSRLVSVRVFFRWLTRQHHLLVNPAGELDLPKKEQRLPRHVLSVAEIAQVLNAAETTSAFAMASGLGLRDRAILETLYSTGIRRTELVNLNCSDLDLERGTLLIRLGKGKKDRMVPIGERALAWITRYQNEVRPDHIDDENEPSLFLSRQGKRQTGKQVSSMAKKVIDSAKLDRMQNAGPLNSSCHLFRHACATHMLENGADIRYIQALLGHTNLSTTEIYTQVAIHKLKQVHDATHPARLPGRAAVDSDAGKVSDIHARETLLALLESDGGADGSMANERRTVGP